MATAKGTPMDMRSPDPMPKTRYATTKRPIFSNRSLHPQVAGLYLRVLPELGGRGLVHNAPLTHDVGVVRQGQGKGQVLLHQDDREPRFLQLLRWRPFP